jgi:hypothetical protein
VRFAAVPAVVALAAVVSLLAAPEQRFLRDWPSPASAAVDRVLRSDPHARVFASYEYPDWLLLASPRTRGRIAYDGRFEVLSHGQLKSVMNYLWRVGGDWERPAADYRLLVLDPQLEKSLVATYDARGGVRTLFRNKDVVVFDQGPR